MTAEPGVLNPVGLERACEGCGSRFTVTAAWERNRFCSRSCAAKRPRRKVKEPDRFWPKVEKTGPCWIWTACLNEAGYGQFSKIGRRLISAHRWSWEQEHGPVPDGLELDHLCRNHACVRPDHLEAVTRAVNAQRGLKGDLLPNPDHCFNGHLMTPENSIRRTDSKGERYRCRQCRADYLHQWYLDNRSAA